MHITPLSSTGPKFQQRKLPLQVPPRLPALPGRLELKILLIFRTVRSLAGKRGQCELRVQAGSSEVLLSAGISRYWRWMDGRMDRWSRLSFQTTLTEPFFLSLFCNSSSVSAPLWPRRHVRYKHFSALITTDAPPSVSVFFFFLLFLRSHSSLRKASLPLLAQRAERHANVSPIPLTDVPANFIQGTVRVRNRAVPVEKHIAGVSAAASKSHAEVTLQALRYGDVVLFSLRFWGV